jgi:gamma-glutamyltranspeptidase/glutathione hydrolase
VDRERTLDDLDEASTTHLIIADRVGNVACATQSLGYHFGAGVAAPGTGFLLNNDMNNFAYQSAGSVNLVGPGKWPRSTMAPTIVLKDGRPVLAIGSPAGQRIPVMILQVAVDVLKFGRELADAVPAPRFHLRRVTGGRPNEIDLETGSPSALGDELERMGWRTFPRTNAGDFYFGSVNAVRFLPDGEMVGVADPGRTNAGGGD